MVVDKGGATWLVLSQNVVSSDQCFRIKGLRLEFRYNIDQLDTHNLQRWD